ncbi:alpha/beta hydrolase [Promicromonospora umidemergens]|uniref:alpha/beta hydrolase n=1 Tax=Promicromonospora umidemergens TaxID=629679 RepID=UPI0020A312CC|nr:alpha/beta hydrolase [Promicromonospora umidemergens]
MSVAVGDRMLPGPHGDLRVRVYEPAADAERVAGLVWAHGGAFMRGDLDMLEADWVARSLADAGVVVVSVDYQLAPLSDPVEPWPGPDRQPTGVRFPVASEEVSFVHGWAQDAGLGVAAASWSLGGASAGGNLAAGASLRLRDAGGPPPRSVLLAYPVAHFQLPPPSVELAGKMTQDWRDPDALASMNANYLGHDGPPTSPYAFPGGQDLRGLPPTFVLNADQDALRSSGEAYAAELAAAGVDVLLVREDGTLHGHLNHPETPGAVRSIARIITWLTAEGLVGTSHEAPQDRTETEAAAR